MEEVGPISEIAAADTAGGSPLVMERTPVDRTAVVADIGEDAFMEASSARYYLYEDDADDDTCCFGLFSKSWCETKPDSQLNEVLLHASPYATVDAESSSNVACCGLFCKDPKEGVTERHTLPRLSSTFMGLGRQTPSSSTRMSSPPSPRGRSSSTHTETMSVNGTPQRRGGQGGQVEVVRKVVMLGARNSGKSSVVHRFAENRFGAAYDPTIESTIRARVEVRGVTFLCDLLDTAGQDEYSNFSRQATVGVHGYCMVFSVTSLPTFQAIQKIRDRITDLVGSYTVPIVLVGTKSDDETHREVPSTMGEALAESWGASYVECSAKSGYLIEDVFVTLLFEIERESGLLVSKDSENSEDVEKSTTCIIS